MESDIMMCCLKCCNGTMPVWRYAAVFIVFFPVHQSVWHWPIRRQALIVGSSCQSCKTGLFMVVKHRTHQLNISGSIYGGRVLSVNQNTYGSIYGGRMISVNQNTSGGIYGGRLQSVNQNTDHIISGK